MTEKNWQKYVDETQFSYSPISLVTLGVFLLLAISRDFVFGDFQLPTWLLILDITGIAVMAITFLVMAMKWLRAADAKAFLFLCFVAVAFRPSIISYFDGTPGTLVLCSVIFAAALLFLTLPHLLITQFITIVIWGVVAGDELFTPPYLVTLALAVAICGVGYWLQKIRLYHLKHTFELENRVENLETIVPICASCKNTRDDDGNWMSVEDFIESQQESAQVSHAICPSCKESLYGDMLRKSKERKEARESLDNAV